LGDLGDCPSVLQKLSPELQNSVIKRQRETPNVNEPVKYQGELINSEDPKVVLFKHVQLVSSIRRLKDSGTGSSSIWPSVTDDRGWIIHVLRFAADLIADFPVKMDSPEQTYITEAISFVKGVLRHEGKASELSGPVAEFLTSVLDMLLEPTKAADGWSCCEAIESVILELAEEPFIGQLLLGMLTHGLQKEFNLVHSGSWNLEKAIATERCGALLLLVFNIVSCNLSSWTSATQLDSDMLLEWIVSFHHLQQQIQRKKSPLLLFAVYTDKITTCIQDSIEKLHSSSTPERDLTGLLGLHCKLKLGTLSNIAGLLYSGAC
ncbi:hypothetical protein CLOM_g12543, partial [Closterium sp. NIES-68]